VKERVEEYLEAILDIQEKEKRAARTSDLAKILNVKPSSVTEMLLKLSKMGYVEYKPYHGATLTEKGKEIAMKIKRYHMIFEMFFKDFLGIDKDKAHKLSCELEHHVNEEIVAKICMIIAKECKICDKCNFEYTSLIDATPDVYEVVICPSALKMVGIKPGISIVVKDKCVIDVNGEELVISPDIAKKTIVKKISQV